MLKELISLLDTPHNLFVDVFGGNASVLLGKPPSPKEVFNDYTYDAINLFTVMQSPLGLKALKDRLRSDLQAPETLSRAVPLAALEPPTAINSLNQLYRKYGVSSTEEHPASPEAAVDRAFDFLRATHYGDSTIYFYRNSPEAAEKALENLDLVSERLKRVQLDNLAWYDLIAKYDSPETLFYIYPNYYSFSQRFTSRDGVSLCEDDHIQLVEALSKIKGKGLVVGFSNELYARLEVKGWKRVEFILGAQGKTTLGNYQINIVWKNY